MKKCPILACVLIAVLLFTACGGAASVSSSAAPAQSATSTAPHGSGADYKALIEAARPAELNELEIYAVVTGPGDALHDTLFSGTFGFVEDDYEKYAVSVGGIITIAYGVLVILPKEGREEAALEQVNAFVQQQQNAMQNYLQDQYVITKAAIVKMAPTGEILLAMCEDAETVMAAMEAGL